MCVCVSVCLSYLRSCERDVVALHFLHCREEFHLASCTNCFSSRYDTPLERKRLWKFFQGYALTAIYSHKKLPVTMGTINPAYPTQKLPVRERVSASLLWNLLSISHNCVMSYVQNLVSVNLWLREEFKDHYHFAWFFIWLVYYSLLAL